jgi:hypothetical protein
LSFNRRDIMHRAWHLFRLEKWEKSDLVYQWSTGKTDKARGTGSIISVAYPPGAVACKEARRFTLAGLDLLYTPRGMS